MKCNHVSARTMEQFRRLGVAQKRARRRPAGRLSERRRLPHQRDRHRADAHPDPVPARPLHRHRAAPTPGGRRPSRRTASTRSTSSRSCSSTRRRLPGVTLLNRTQVTGFAQDDDGVSGAARRPRHRRDAQHPLPLPGRLRRRPLARAQADRREARRHAVIQRVQSTYIRAPGAARADSGQAARGRCYAVNPRRCGTMFAIDGHETWLVHNHLNADEPEFDSVDRDRVDPRDPRRRRRLPLRGDQQGGLDRPPPRRRPLSRRPRLHRRRRRAPVGAVRRLRHERRHRRRRSTSSWLLAALRRRAGRDAAHPRRLRGRAPADHRAGLALRDGPCASR